MKFGTVVVCSKCKQPIVSGQGYGYVCFKIPGKEGYHFFQQEDTRKIRPRVTYSDTTRSTLLGLLIEFQDCKAMRPSVN